MRTVNIRSSLVPSALVAAFSLAFLGSLFAAGGSGTDPAARAGAAPAAADNKYIGADKCKSCHGKAEVGDQYGHWKQMKHAKAFETLASDAAKKIVAEKGIADAQKADQCVKCHVTAFGVPPANIKKGFELADGVQCETCHGPGEKHMKARFAAAASADKAGGPQAVPADEIVLSPDQKVCLECHNAESPTFESFCFHEFSAKVRHRDPRKERQTLDIGACSCPICADGCPPEHAKLAEVIPGK
jgi:hypothetical protein